MMLQRFLSILVVLLITTAIGVGQSQSSGVPVSITIDASQLLLDLKTLSADDMEGRLVGTPGGIKAREYVMRRFKESGLKPFGESYSQPFEFSYPRKPNEKIHGANVVGYIKGEQTPDKYIIVTAHYDHLGVKNGVVYNGADDNASGTAALFSLAQYFSKHPPAHSFIFVATDAEEGSGAGAVKFVKEPPVDKKALVLNVNVDAICRDKNDILYAVGTRDYPFLKPYLEPVASQSGIKLLFGHDDPSKDKGEDYWPPLQDGISFHRAGIPYIYFGVEDYELMHKPADDYDNITPLFYVHAVETIDAALKEFDAHLPEIEQQWAKVRAKAAQ